ELSARDLDDPCGVARVLTDRETRPETGRRRPPPRAAEDPLSAEHGGRVAPRPGYSGDTALAEALRGRDLRLHPGVGDLVGEIGEQVSRLEAARQARVVDEREIEQRLDVRIAGGDLGKLNMTVGL